MDQTKPTEKTSIAKQQHNILPVTIWMNVPSFYQLDLLEALAATKEVDLKVIYARELTSDRKALGWEIREIDVSSQTLQSSRSILDAMRIAWCERTRLHIVNGIWAEPAFFAALLVLRITNTRYLIYAEAPNPTIKPVYIKQFIKYSFGRWIARGAVGLLSISHFSSDYFTRLGIAKKRVYPFGYFQKSFSTSAFKRSISQKTSNPKVKIVFVGQLIPRKGIDILIKTLGQLRLSYPDIRLTLIGDGSFRKSYEDLVHTYNLTDIVTFLGVLPSNSVRDQIMAADILVLPSRWDGWGMVVNEALSVGVPVIVSDRCGAADIIQHKRNGYVFRSDNIKDLYSCIDNFLSHPEKWQSMKEAALDTAKKISAETSAEYLVRCLEHAMLLENNQVSKPAPLTPWSINERTPE
jgi:glycosyltransferase involved in cell wall biosynthesis